MTTRRSVRLAVAIVAFVLVLLLGHAVGRGPDPDWLMALEVPLVNHSTLIAWWLTWFGYAYILIPVCAGLIALAIVRPWWRVRTPFAILSLLISWQGADLFQKHFMRPRRLDWVVKHETAFSFPSSHAAISIGFYALLAVFVWQSALPRRRLVAALIGLLACGIIWSRLALAAHYATDLLGGALLATAVVGLLSAVWPRNVFEERTPSS